MKKLLALVLALVMTMGLATVGTNAALTTYGDADAFEHDEAIAVVSAVGILSGYPDGTFHPETVLTRAEAAKIVAYMLTNNTTADSLVGTGKYSDVPANNWAAGYIEFLSTEGVLNGDGSGKFYPGDNLTVAAFAKMLLVSLGYDSNKEGLVGDDWIIYTTKLAADNKLFATLGDIAPRDEVTREQAAQMALNAMKAPLVEYTNKGGSITVNGATVDLGGSGFTYVTATTGAAQHISSEKLTNSVTGDTRYMVEFAENKYPDLILDDNDEDPFGRPASTWTYGKETIGTFVNRDKLIESYHVAVTGADLFNLLGEARIKNSEIVYEVNGFVVEYDEPENVSGVNVYKQFGISAKNMIRSNKIPYAFTGNGVLTEVYEKGAELKIVSIFTYYATANGNYNATRDELKLTYSVFTDGTAATSTLKGNNPAPTFLKNTFATKVSNEDVPGVNKYVDKDKLLVRVAYNSNTGLYDVIEVEEPTVEKDVTISKYSQKVVSETIVGASVDTGLFYEGYVITGGETKEFSKAVYPGDKLSSYLDDGRLAGTFDLVYDSYGYLIYAKANSSSSKYVFIAAVDNFTSNLGTRTADAYAIFENGDDKIITVNVLKTDENISKYEEARAGAGETDSKKYGAVVDKDYSIRYDVLNAGASTPHHAYNRWFTYSVSGEGANEVYTLTPAANSLMVGSESAINGNKSVNPQSARIIGDYTYQGVDVATSQANRVSAWGNDNSVYVTVKTARTSSGNDGKAYHTVDDTDTSGVYQRAIAEVAHIYTGVQSIKLEPYEKFTGNLPSTTDFTETNPYPEWIYAVYDNGSHYIKTAIILGKDKTSTDSYVYAVSSAGSQWREGSYNYWSFNAIVDGEEKELTVKSKYTETIENIRSAVGFSGGGADTGVGGLFEVKYDADGYVTTATQVAFTGVNSKNIYNNTYIGGNDNTVGVYASELDSFKLYNTYFAAGDTYRANGNTLRNTFNETVKTNTVYELDSDIGLTIAPNAPIFTVQQRYWPSSGVTETLVEQHATFKDALGAIADSENQTSAPTDSKAFSGFVTAALNTNGSAKWVVLKNVGTYVDMNNNTGSSNVGPTVSYDPQITLSAYTTNSDVGDFKSMTVTLRNFEDGHTAVELYKSSGGTPAFTFTVNVVNGVGVATISKDEATDLKFSGLTADYYYASVKGTKYSSATVEVAD